MTKVRIDENMTYPLRICVWELTLACCFSCKYCGSSGGKARDGELSTAECLDVAQQLADAQCQRVALIGGEVFLRPDWPQITAALTSRGIRVSVITNGFLFTPELIAQLKEIGIESVAVSLDGLQTIHDRFRQEGSFARASRAIDALAAGGIPVSVISTLNQLNVLQLEEFYQFLRTKPIFAWQLQACSPMGNAARSGLPYAFDFRTVAEFIRSHLAEAPFRMGMADNLGYFAPGKGLTRGNLTRSGIFPGCQAGLTVLGIDSVGNVRGCESMYDETFIEGNLRQKSLLEIWNDPEAFAYNRRFRPEMLTGACARCTYGPQCAGGCRSYNFFTHGKLYESRFCISKEHLPE